MNNIESKEFRNTSTGQDVSKLFKILHNHLPENTSLLVLGIGSGRDLELLSKRYNVTGSDFSKLLLSMYGKSHPNVDLITLDPAEPKTERKFDCIYTNKVLHQMSEDALIISLQNQLKLLNGGGLAFHSFWSGSKEENHHGLKWVYYTEESLSKLIPKEFEILELKTYEDKIDHDSIYIILRKNNKM